MSTQSPTGVQEWRDIDWPKVETDVHTLQRRIYRASQKGDGKLVHRQLLPRSNPLVSYAPQAAKREMPVLWNAVPTR
jgi:hypothetical protein